MHISFSIPEWVFWILCIPAGAFILTLAWLGLAALKGMGR